jgi:phosphoserine phosphatase
MSDSPRSESPAGLARRLRCLGSLVGAWLLGAAGLSAAAPEPHAAAILRELLETRDAVVAARHHATGQAVFLAFWDFDGTLLKGDCSEGLVEDGKTVYPGLAQLGIERGLVAGYKPTGGFADFWKDYEYMDQRVGHWLAYPFIPQMFRGARAADVVALAREHFAAVLHRYYFAGSMQVLRGLESAGVENHVMSASGELFVRGAAATLGLPEERLHGIVVRVDTAGRLTSDIVPPVTWAEGKRAELLAIVAAAQEAHPGAEVYVLAAFGNSYGTDGSFLDYTARQTLPAERRGLAVMINGGPAPERYHGHFREVIQAATVE